MGAVRDGDFQQAYSLSSPALQRELGDAQRMGANVGNYRPSEWSWSQRSISNGIGRLEGSVTYSGGNSGRARLELHHRVDGEWRGRERLSG